MAPETANPPLTAVGSYDLIEKIAEGGMGSIYKGRHRETGQIVAIKVMPRHLTHNSVLLRRFEQEFRAATQLDQNTRVKNNTSFPADIRRPPSSILTISIPNIAGSASARGDLFQSQRGVETWVYGLCRRALRSSATCGTA